MQADRVIHYGDRAIRRIGRRIMQGYRSRHADSGIDHDFPPIWQVNINGLVQTNAHDLSTELLYRIAVSQ